MGTQEPNPCHPMEGAQTERDREKWQQKDRSNQRKTKDGMKRKHQGPPLAADPVPGYSACIVLSLSNHATTLGASSTPSTPNPWPRSPLPSAPQTPCFRCICLLYFLPHSFPLNMCASQASKVEAVALAAQCPFSRQNPDFSSGKPRGSQDGLSPDPGVQNHIVLATVIGSETETGSHQALGSLPQVFCYNYYWVC